MYLYQIQIQLKWLNDLYIENSSNSVKYKNKKIQDFKKQNHSKCPVSDTDTFEKAK